MAEFHVPQYVFFTKGVGTDKEKLASFELALRDAKIYPYNLVYVSSILPPKCKEKNIEEGTKYFHEGQEVFCVLARNETNEPHKLIASSIGIANPPDENIHGYISEYHGDGKNDEWAGFYAEKLAIKMFASGKGIPFDSDNYSPEKYSKSHRVGDYVLRTRNISQSAVGNKDNLWTTVIAAAVFIPVDPTKYILSVVEENYKLKEAIAKIESISSGYISENGNLKSRVELVEKKLDQVTKTIGANSSKLSSSLEEITNGGKKQ